MESLLYNLPFSGSVSIISHGANIGSLSVSYHQKDAKGNEDLSIEYDKGLVSIVNPRDYI